MRKMIIMGLMAAVAIPSIASAQSAGELRHDDRQIQRERHELQDARRYGTPQDVREERHDLREARQEKREDWRDYREAHRDIYRRPAWVGPRGHAYRPVVVGYRFAPEYYSGRYVIANPWRYRLPPAAGWNRWVRYGNDVVLVNVRTGRVIEVHSGFFW
ncbi:regulator RcnB of Ni and Co efflux [Sphingomonas sp. YR710]|jgi:Ni/Co efflux regulator RcnB|uniref:RcnB family protein n=1 Tax=Sphingomonas sp. YR710 TaxID=1882773 RepID=UPI000883A57E|nr:RcnB family protein [Sphingomonas sp. YR710]SDC01125.1 regulator RcnB of Ni and Co efflux [Sphingomonas sp. YR710]